MRIIIAGATGFIGTALTRRLLTSNHSLVILSRRERLPDVESSPPLLNVARWDGKSLGKWADLIEESDAVINLSGASIGSGRWTTARKAEILRSRLDSTAVIVESIRRASTKPGVLINASAVGYYGDVPNGEVSEDHPPGNDFLSTVVEQWERKALEATPLGVRTVLLRSGLILDPQGGALARMLLPYRFFTGGPLGTGNQWVPWIHRVDEIEAIVFALEQATLSGPINVCAPTPVTMDEFSTALGTVLHRPSLVRVPPLVLKLMLGEMSGLVLTGQHAVPDKLIRAGFKFGYADIRSALGNLLGARPKEDVSVDGDAKLD